MAEDVVAFGVGDEGEVDLGGLVAVVGEEAIDAAEEEADAAFAVGEDESSSGEAFASPALDGLARDGEFFGDVIDAEDRLGEGGTEDVHRCADGFDEEADVVLEGGAGEEFIAACLGAVVGDFIDDEVEGVGFGGVEGVEEVFGAGELGGTDELRRKFHLPRKLGDVGQVKLSHH